MTEPVITEEGIPTAPAAVADGGAAPVREGLGEPLVVVRDLVKYYPIFGGVLRRHVGDVRAVDGVSFDVRAGEILGLVGESGCGKSTLGKTLLQLLPATAGSVTLRGEDVLGRKGDELKRLRRRMQIMFQDPVSSLNPRMPVSDIIGEGLVAQADKENRLGRFLGPRTARRRLPGDRGPATRLRSSVPARVLGGSATAHRHRAGARAGAGVHRLRRAGVRTGRLHPVVRSSTCCWTCDVSSA